MEDKAAHKIWLARRSSRFSRFQEGHGVRVAGGQGLSVTLASNRQGLSVSIAGSVGRGRICHGRPRPRCHGAGRTQHQAMRVQGEPLTEAARACAVYDALPTTARHMQ